MSSVAIEKENPILTGSITKQLLIFFFPIMMGSFFQQLYNTIDAFIVGNFVGAAALAAVGGSAALIVALVVGFFMGLSSGAGVIISQHYGAGDMKKVEAGIHTAYAFSVIGGIVMTILGVAFSEKILEMMNTPAETFGDSAIYLKIYFSGMLFVFIFNIGSGIMRAMGNSKMPLYFLIISSILNIILDLGFVLVFNMGVKGVAIATLIAQAVTAVLVTLYLMFNVPECPLQIKKIRMDKNLLKGQLRIGVPGGIQSTMYTISNMIVQTAVNGYGTMVVAGWIADGKIETFFWMFQGALGAAVTTFVGQNYGAGKKDRVYKSIRVAVILYMIMTAIFVSCFVAFRYPLISLFTDNAEAIEIGATMLKVITPGYFMFCFVEIFSGALRGMGDVLVPTIITLVGVCLLRIFWIWFVIPHTTGLYYIMILYPITWGVAGVLFIVYYLYKKRKL